MTPRVVMALPCYNEAENIDPLLEQFKKLNTVHQSNFVTEVIVIDDCSTDNTQEVLEKWKNENWVRVVRHNPNKGLTGGINTAFEEFHKTLSDENVPIALGLMDGDNSHSPLHVPSMVAKMLIGFDVVVASRYQPGSRIMGVSTIRQILSFGLAMLFKLFRNIPGVRDYSCGYRLYSPRIVREVKKHFPSDVVFEKSFASMVEVLVKCHLLGAVCTEVPFLLRYDFKLGESKMPFKKTILDNFKLLRTLKSVEGLA